MVDNPLNSPSYSRIVRLLAVLCPVLASGLLLLGAQAFAAGAPEAPITGECHLLVITVGEGPLCGTLNPHTSEKLSSAYFVYNAGSSCMGGSRRPAETEPGGELEGQEIEVHGNLDGLRPGTEYTYCLVAANSSGETFGQPVSFTTTAEPKIEAATAVTSTSATLEGTLEPPGTELEYRFWLSKGTTCEGGVGASPAEGENKVAVRVEGLTPNTEYTFCLVAQGREGFAFDGEKDWGAASGGPEHFTTLESQAEKEAKEKLEQEVKAKAEAEVKARAEAKAKAETEAAVAKKEQEEAAAKKQEEEAAAAAAQKKKESESASEPVSLTIVKVRVTANSVTITLDASREGAVTIFGSGLKTANKGVAAGSNRIRVAFTKIGKSYRRHHRKVRIEVQMKAAGKAISGSRMVKL